MNAETIQTYNTSAKQYADKYAVTGSRVAHIEEAFSVFAKPNPHVLELGCGDGRDAVELCKRTDSYTGIDMSIEMLKLASIKAPQAQFECAFMEDYSAGQVDIIFAFASLLHTDIETFTQILQKFHGALSAGGLFHIGVKYGKYSGPVRVKDAFGTRIFYYYTETDIIHMAQGYKVLSTERSTIGTTQWVDILLQKIEV
jgi:predicted TPR repeat methyltransferase